MAALNYLVWFCAVAFWLLLLYCAMIYIEHARICRWVKRNCQMESAAEMVVIMPGVNWRKPLAWLKPNFHLDEIKAVRDFAKARGRVSSFFIGPDFETVEKIMAAKSVREVCFVGHGGAHYFKLNTVDTLCYCEFADRGKYGKEFVHQIHCGVPYGKTLIDYVVPEANKAGCFFALGEINGHFIETELKRLANYKKT